MKLKMMKRKSPPVLPAPEALYVIHYDDRTEKLLSFDTYKEAQRVFTKLANVTSDGDPVYSNIRVIKYTPELVLALTLNEGPMDNETEATRITREEAERGASLTQQVRDATDALDRSGTVKDRETLGYRVRLLCQHVMAQDDARAVADALVAIVER